MLPENFATPPDNRGPGQHLPPVPTVYLQSGGQFIFAGPGDPPVRIHSWVRTGDRTLETEKADVVSGAPEMLGAGWPHGRAQGQLDGLNGAQSPRMKR